jgi:large subunit ribosomal protein L21
MYAIVKTGGKQYRIAANDLISVERLAGAPGDVVELGQVLLVAGDAGIEVGSPLLAGATVTAEIVDHVRGDRIIVFKKRRRHHYRRRNGHRQDLTRIRIAEILTGGAKPSKKAAAKPAEAEAAPMPAETPAAEHETKDAATIKADASRAARPKAKAKASPAAKPKTATRDKAAKKPPAKKK